jgi:F420-non-reducing hydrogenase iron-sulfur subunit
MTVKRMLLLQELLDFVGLGGRLHLEWISSAEAQKFVKVVTDFTEKIRALGPNPLKALPLAPMLPGPRALAAAGSVNPTVAAACSDIRAQGGTHD